MNPPVATGAPDTTGQHRPLALRDFHPFEAHGARFLYMVPSAGIFRMDEAGCAVLDLLQSGARRTDDIVSALSDDFEVDRILGTVAELTDIRAIGDPDAPSEMVWERMR